MILTYLCVRFEFVHVIAAFIFECLNLSTEGRFHVFAVFVWFRFWISWLLNMCTPFPSSGHGGWPRPQAYLNFSSSPVTRPRVATTCTPLNVYFKFPISVIPPSWVGFLLLLLSHLVFGFVVVPLRLTMCLFDGSDSSKFVCIARCVWMNGQEFQCQLFDTFLKYPSELTFFWFLS